MLTLIMLSTKFVGVCVCEVCKHNVNDFCFHLYVIWGSIVKLITFQSRKRSLSLKRFYLSPDEDSEVVGMEDLGQLR